MEIFWRAFYFAHHPYIPVYGMSLGAQAIMLMALRLSENAAAIPMSFFVESVRTSAGRRRPVIVAGGLLGVLSLIPLTFPPLDWLHAQRGRALALQHTIPSSRNCTAVRERVMLGIRDGTLHPAFPEQRSTPSHNSRSLRESAPIGKNVQPQYITVWVGFCNFFSWAGWNVASLAYRAFAFELATTSNERITMFQARNMFGGVAKFTLEAFIVYLSTVNSANMLWQVRCVVLAAMVATAASIAIFSTVPENVSTYTAGAHTQMPNIVSTMRVLMRDNPTFLLMARQSVVAYIAHMIPESVFAVYLTSVLHVENVTLMSSKIAIFLALTTFFTMPLGLELLRTLGKKRAMCIGSLWHGISSVLYGLIPSSYMIDKNVIFVMLGSNSCVDSMARTAPDLLTAELIDYDALLHGQRRGALYLAMSNQILNFVWLLTDSLPATFLAQLGYRNNGGCQCGCGAPCRLHFQRWVCPDDIGYACSTSLTQLNPPFFGDETRPPPCTLQPHAVVFVTKLCMFYVAPALQLANIYFILKYPITENLHSEILRQYEKRRRGARAYDPVKRQHLPRLRSEKEQAYMSVINTFAANELRVNAQERLPLVRFQRALCHIVLWTILFMSLTIASAFFAFSSGGGIATKYVLISIGLLFFIAVVWNLQKVCVLAGSARALTAQFNLTKFLSLPERRQTRTSLVKRRNSCLS